MRPLPHPVVRASLLGAAVVVTVVALTGCGILNRIAGGQQEDVFNVGVGDCLADDALSAEVSSVQTVPCSQAHYYEVYSSYTVDDGPFPGNGSINDTATEYCQGAAFTTFIGEPYASSPYYTERLVPTEQSWNELNDREILCMVYEPDTTTTGTLENVALGEGGGGASDDGASDDGGSGSDVDVSGMQVGDCLTEDTPGSVETASCSGSHYYEVFDSYIADDGPYPGESALQDTASDYCQGEAFTQFIGEEYPYSEIYTEHLLPTEDAWNNAGHREILCLAYEPDTQLTGSLQGANR